MTDEKLVPIPAATHAIVKMDEKSLPEPAATHAIAEDDQPKVGVLGSIKVKSSIEDVGPCKKKLSIEISADHVKKTLQESVEELRRDVILPGFRKGHAPLPLIEKRFGSDIRKEVKSNLVVRGLQQALEDKKVKPISDPDMDIDAIEMSEDKPLAYELTVEVWPEFELKESDYEGMKLEKPSSAPAPEEIEVEVQALRTRTTTFDDLKDEGAAGTDFLICDYTVMAGDKEVVSAKDAGIRADDGVVGRLKIDEVKTALAGRKAGDSVNLEFKIDHEYYQEEFRDAQAALSLNVKGVKRPRTPEATDEWAKELGFESLEELQTVISRNVEAAKESRADASLRMQIYDKLVGLLSFDLPEDAVRRQQKSVIKRERTNLQMRGATDEDFAKIDGKLEEASLERAQRDLKLFFILSTITERLEIKASQADVDMRVAELATRYRTTVAKMRDHLKREDMLPQLALEIREEKTVAHILSKAEIADAPCQQDKGDQEAAGGKRPKQPRIAKSGQEPDAKAGSE